jgi:hypothetical protein
MLELFTGLFTPLATVAAFLLMILSSTTLLIILENGIRSRFLLRTVKIIPYIMRFSAIFCIISGIVMISTWVNPLSDVSTQEIIDSRMLKSHRHVFLMMVIPIWPYFQILLSLGLAGKSFSVVSDLRENGESYLAEGLELKETKNREKELKNQGKNILLRHPIFTGLGLGYIIIQILIYFKQ